MRQGRKNLRFAHDFYACHGALGAAGLLAVFGTLSGGRLHIDNLCDIRRGETPVTFFLVVIAATIVFGGMLAVCVLSFAAVFAAGAG